MTAPILSVAGLVKRFGGLVATDNVSLTVSPGEIHALIGPNGAGKTTLVSQIVGELKPDEGAIVVQGRDVTSLPTHRRIRMGLARTFQVTCLLPEYTAAENVAVAVQVRQGHSFRFWADARRDRSLREEAMALLAGSGMAARADVLVANLSHGERKQLELVMALATKPKVLLLDEPMAGLGPTESRQMVEHLRRLKSSGGMLLVEHDMDAVFALADRISVLVYGRIIASGSVEAIRDNPEVRAAYLGEEQEAC